MTFTIPGGKDKGVAFADASESSLKYWLGRISTDLEANPEKSYADRDRQWVAAAKKELASRGLDPADVGARAPAPQNRPAQSAALARSPQSSAEMVVGSSHNAIQVNRMLEEAAANAHLVSPATVCGSLPPGCEVALSLVRVDANTERGGPGEVAPVGGGKLSLSGFVLKRIGAAAGVSWDMNASGRLDNGSDPHYAHYRAVAWVRNFDGSMRCLSGEVEIDMREGSPQIVAMKARSKEGANLESQIRDTRLFLLRHAETKAKLRAIADMGVKRSYTADELKKPFQVARLMWTGRTEDPELRRIFAEKTADAMIGASSALYGGQPAPAVRPAPAALPTTQAIAALGHAPPPMGATDPDYEEIEQPYADVPEARPSPRPNTQPTAEADATTY